MPTNRAADLDTLREAKPYLRGALALVLFLRAPDLGKLDAFYAVADLFIERLEKDLTKETE